MAKVRPCKHAAEGCPYPAHEKVQDCVWHWLLRRPAYSGTIMADRRRSKTPEHKYRARVPKSEWPEGERWCAGCQSFVPLFYCQGSRCKACASDAAHASQVEKTYELTGEEYRALLERQGGVCAICKGRPQSKRLAVDHDHKTGEVRGLLCSRCNHDGLGAFHDSVLLLWRAVAYLLMPPAPYGPEERTRDALLERLGEELMAATKAPPPTDDPPPF
jgi:hypothetical protein